MNTIKWFLKSIKCDWSTTYDFFFEEAKMKSTTYDYLFIMLFFEFFKKYQIYFKI